MFGLWFGGGDAVDFGGVRRGVVEPVKGLDWSGVDFTPKSTPYVKKAVELQGSNTAPV